MTQGDAGAAGQTADPGRAAALQPADSSALAPLGQRVFRWLWLAVLISWIGTWMQTVGAQWLLVDEPNAAALVSLVQAAGTLPMMLLALPGGVLADSFDRRWLLITVQGYLFVVALLLAVLTAAGLMPPALLLAFTFALGVGAAVQIPAWQAMMPELVPTDTVAGGGQVGPGQRQPGLCGRTGAGRAGDRPPRWRPGRLRRQGGSRCLFRARAVLRAPAAGGIGSPPGTFRAGAARRRPLHLARTRRAPHPAPDRPVRRAGDGAVGAAAADRQPTVGPRGGRLRSLVRRVRPRRHCRRGGAGTGEGPAVQQRDARRRRPSLRGRHGRDRAGPRLSGGPCHPGVRRAGLDGGDLDAGRRVAAVPAGLGPRTWPRRLHGHLHRFDDGRIAAVGIRGRRSRPADRILGRGRRHACRRRSPEWSGGCQRPVTSTPSPSCIGRRHDWLSTPRPTPDPSW